VDFVSLERAQKHAALLLVKECNENFSVNSGATDRSASETVCNAAPMAQFIIVSVGRKTGRKCHNLCRSGCPWELDLLEAAVALTQGTLKKYCRKSEKSLQRICELDKKVLRRRFGIIDFSPEGEDTFPRCASSPLLLSVTVCVLHILNILSDDLAKLDFHSQHCT
jgi:hypothetical protein